MIGRRIRARQRGKGVPAAEPARPRTRGRCELHRANARCAPSPRVPSSPNKVFSPKVRSWTCRSRLNAAMSLTGDASRHLLMDPEFWRSRLERLEKEPRQLAIFPRSDLSRPGIEVLELRVRAHDGARLTALLARSSFAETGLEVSLRACTGPGQPEPDLAAVESGGTDLLLRYPPDRRLEDRVMDVLRIVEAACSLESLDATRVHFHPSDSCVQDEFAIVQFLRQEGWLKPQSDS